MTVLRRAQFGNPVLREKTRMLEQSEITSPKIRELIDDMKHTLASKKLGVGLAAPQVGELLAIAVIKIQPTELRPSVKPFETVLINPVISKTIGMRSGQWEGCISAGSSGKADLFAKVPRFGAVEVRFLDHTGKAHRKTFKGLQAQIVQHEVDHLEGKLFVDRVRDTKTFMTYKEYLKRVKDKPNKVI